MDTVKNNNELLKNLKKANDVAMNKVKGKEIKLDIFEILKVVANCAQSGKTPKEIIDAVPEEYKDFAKTYVKSFVECFATDEISSMLKDSDSPELQTLSKKSFSKKLVKTSEKIIGIIQKYVNNEIDQNQLAEQLLNSGVKSIGKDILDAYHFDVKDLEKVKEMLKESSTSIVAYIAFSEVYKIFMQAAEESFAEHERYLEIRKQCDESIQLIVEYRQKMEETISNYFTDNIEVFEEGFSQMDKALLEDDVNGYLKGNAEIQKLLGYDVQFSNEDEFENLMNSDKTFKF